MTSITPEFSSPPMPPPQEFWAAHRAQMELGMRRRAEDAARAAAHKAREAEFKAQLRHLTQIRLDQPDLAPTAIRLHSVGEEWRRRPKLIEAFARWPIEISGAGSRAAEYLFVTLILGGASIDDIHAFLVSTRDHIPTEPVARNGISELMRFCQYFQQIEPRWDGTTWLRSAPKRPCRHHRRIPRRVSARRTAAMASGSPDPAGIATPHCDAAQPDIAGAKTLADYSDFLITLSAFQKWAKLHSSTRHDTEVKRRLPKAVWVARRCPSWYRLGELVTALQPAFDTDLSMLPVTPWVIDQLKPPNALPSWHAKATIRPGTLPPVP